MIIDGGKIKFNPDGNFIYYTPGFFSIHTFNKKEQQQLRQFLHATCLSICNYYTVRHSPFPSIQLLYH